MAWQKELEYTLISKEIYMRVNGTMIYKMEEERKNMLTVHFLKDYMLMERKMEMASTIIKMVQNILAS